MPMFKAVNSGSRALDSNKDAEMYLGDEDQSSGSYFYGDALNNLDDSTFFTGPEGVNSLTSKGVCKVLCLVTLIECVNML